MPTDQPDDADAMRFGLLWAEARGAVEGYLHGLVTDHQAADELVQDVAVAAFRSFANWRPTGSFTVWTLGIASNLLKMRWRSLARNRRVFADPTLIESLAAMNAEMDDVLDVERNALRDCLRQVQGRAWDMLRMHYFEHVQTGDIAERLGVAAGQVRVQLHRIRQALRTCIQRRIAAEADHG
jgi:RNA polymerase sigma-70 factor (ECF subfamily)